MENLNEALSVNHKNIKSISKYLSIKTGITIEEVINVLYEYKKLIMITSDYRESINILSLFSLNYKFSDRGQLYNFQTKKVEKVNCKYKPIIKPFSKFKEKIESSFIYRIKFLEDGFYEGLKFKKGQIIKIHKNNLSDIKGKYEIT